MKALVSTVIFCACLGFVAHTIIQPSQGKIWVANLEETASSTLSENKRSLFEEEAGPLPAQKNTSFTPASLSGVNKHPFVNKEDFNKKPNLNAGEALAIKQIAALKETLRGQGNKTLHRTLKVGRGQTLVDVITKAGIKRTEALSAIRALKGTVNPKRIKTGQKVFLTLLKNNKTTKLQELGLEINFDTLVTAVNQNQGTYKKSLRALPTVTVRQIRSGIIEDSLYLAAKNSKVPPSVLTELIRIFSYDVDFQRQIRKGDGFKLYFDRKYRKDTGKIEEGKILFAELTLRGKPLGFYHFKTKTKSSADYFDAEGKSAQKALMKTPVDGARLSSNFGNRKDPIKGYRKLHTGVDFGARRGTPIMAAGNGIIEKAGRNGAYGNYVRIRHNGTYKSAYAHMKSFARGIRAGRRVKQGQIIGYVGNTGRSTGPHLHYEVFVNGRASNPMRLKFPTEKKLRRTELKAFNLVKTSLVAEMDNIKNSLLAANLYQNMPQAPESLTKTEEDE